MKCKIEYQYRPKNRTRPDDCVQEVTIDPALPVCTENPIPIYRMIESAKLAR